MALDASRQQVEVIGDGFEGVIDFVCEADSDLARRGKLFAPAHSAQIAGEADRTDLATLFVVDYRA